MHYADPMAYDHPRAHEETLDYIEQRSYGAGALVVTQWDPANARNPDHISHCLKGINLLPVFGLFETNQDDSVGTGKTL